MKKLNIEEMRSIAEQRGGVCLSTEYINQKTKLLWQCTSGHQWKAQANNVQSGGWCPYCAGHMQLTINEMYQLAQSRGGKCLSDKYRNARSKLEWLCSKGHRWYSTPDSVKSGHWCPVCASDLRSAKKRKYTVDRCHKHAAKKGGQCLSSDYPSKGQKLRWQCSQGHVWEAATSSVFKQNSWCPTCARGTLNIEQMMDIAHTRGGKCLSTEYINLNRKLMWECSLGHTWMSTPASVVNQGTWCPVCKGTLPLTIDEMREIAFQRGGKCLSDTYQNARTPLQWKCAEGHTWTATPCAVKLGSWCPQCYKDNRSALAIRKYTLEDMKKLATNRRGDCLSSYFKNVLEPLAWRCALGHEWIAPPASIIHNNSWCPSCSRYLGERLCRVAFEQIFGRRFPKARPKWLRSSNSTQLELDGYCPSLGIAFEHHGEQHYSDNIQYIKTTSQLQKRIAYDKQKRILCQEHNVTLIEVPEVPRLTKLDQLGEFIIAECHKMGVDVPHDRSVLIDYGSAYVPDHRHEVIRELAEAKQGECLTKSYYGMRHRYLWRCKEGHTWKQTASVIKTGIWCPYCSGRHNITLESLKELALNRGGECLSNHYRNNTQYLLWKCNKHNKTFSAPAKRVLKGQWCPLCRNNEEERGSNFIIGKSARKVRKS